MFTVRDDALLATCRIVLIATAIPELRVTVHAPFGEQLTILAGIREWYFGG